jgi:hypothetical protein
MARASSRSSRSGRFEAGVIESLTHAVPPHVKKILRPRTWAVTILFIERDLTRPRIISFKKSDEHV